MKVVGRHVLHEFLERHADCRKWIANWIRDVETAAWPDSHAIKATYPSASFIADNVVVFNVKGNDYRLFVQVAYRSAVVSIKWIGTHAEYSKRLH